MKHTTTKCYCDRCKEEMGELAYEEAVQVAVIAYVPNPKGGCREQGSKKYTVCNKCAEAFGIKPAEIHSGMMGADRRVTDAITQFGLDIIKFVFGKRGDSDVS